MKKYLVKFGLFLAKLGGWKEITLPPVSLPPQLSGIPDSVSEYLPFTVSLVKAIDGQFKSTSGEFRHAEAVRVLLNKFPTAKQRDLSLAIELAVQKCSG